MSFVLKYILWPCRRLTTSAVPVLGVPCTDAKEIHLPILELRQGYGHWEAHCPNIAQGLPVLGLGCLLGHLIAKQLIVLYLDTVQLQGVHSPRQHDARFVATYAYFGCRQWACMWWIRRYVRHVRGQWCGMSLRYFRLRSYFSWTNC